MSEETIKITSDDEEVWQAETPPPTSPSAADDDSLHTYLADDDELATWHVASEDALSEERQAPWGHLARGKILCEHYRVERTLRAHETQRAGLYLCHGPEGWVIVKVYAVAYPPKEELWQRLTELRHSNILHVYRTIEADGFYYEMQELCPGGSLEDRVPKQELGIPPVSAEWLTRLFVPQMAAALRYLHRQEIIHRDIKPANIYVKEVDGKEALVLADFDIASVLEQARTSRDTQRAAGTWIYTAPEAFPRFLDNRASSRGGRVSRSCDYYSLGISIIELLLGTTSLHLCQLPDLFDFYLQGGRVEIPSSIPGRISLLLRGLLIRNRRLRWGEAEVERWLAGQTTDADMQRIHDDDYFELARASRPYKLNTYMCVDLPSLAEAMWHEQETAKEDLISADILLNWVGTLDTTAARKIRREREREFLYPDVLLHSAIMHCDPTRAFIFPDGSEVTTPEEWISLVLRWVRERRVHPETFCTPALMMQLEAWLRCKENPEPAWADSVAAIRSTSPQTQLEELAYMLLPDRPYPLMAGVVARTPKDMVALTYGPAEGWRGKKRPACYEASFARWNSGALNAWLRQRGLALLATQCDQIRAQFSAEPLAAFETILRLLDPRLPQVAVNLDVSEVASCQVTHKRQRSYALRYRTIGPGMPFGALVLANNPTGLTLDEHTLRTRTGEVHLTIDAQQDIKVLQTYTSSITLESGVARLTNETTEFSYRVVYPISYLVQRVLIAASIGAGVLGIPRIALSIMGQPGPVSLRNPNFAGSMDQLNRGHFELIAFVFALFILGTCIFIGLRCWFHAYRRSEI